MSGLLNAAIPGGAAGLLPSGATGLFPISLSWKDRLLPASFRGVPFEVQGHELGGGRRGVVHEFVGRERPVTEDLGKAAERYMIDAFLIGDNYDQQRAALKAAVYDTAGPGLLVHPWLGNLTVQVLPGCSIREQLNPQAIAWFRIACVDAGISPFARATVDPSSDLLAKAAAVLQALQAGYSVAVAVAATGPGILYNALADGLAGLGNAVIGLPAGSLQSVVLAASGFAAAVADPDATGAAVAAGFQAVAAAIVANPPAGGDPSGGLAALTSWAGAVYPQNPAATPVRGQQQANAAALTALAQGCATAALAQLYAQTGFLSAQAALAARTQLLAAIDAQADQADAEGDDGSYAAWQDLAASAANYLSADAQSLPQQGSYVTARPLPSAVLAYRLYQDANQADALEQWNSALHPLFMPSAGVFLTPVAS